MVQLTEDELVHSSLFRIALQERENIVQRAEELLGAEKLRWKREKDDTRKLSEALREAENARSTSCHKDLVLCFHADFRFPSHSVCGHSSLAVSPSRRLVFLPSGPVDIRAYS